MSKEKRPRRVNAGRSARKTKELRGPLPTNFNLWLTAKDAIDDINCVAWSPTGSTVAVAGRGRVVRLWDATTKRTRQVFEAGSSVVRSVAWSPDGGLLAASGDGGFVRAWDVKTGSPLDPPDVHRQPVHSVAFSPNGKMIASAGADKTIHLWSVHTGQTFQVLRGHDDWVYSLSWAADGSTLASGAADGAVMLWDVRSGRAVKALKVTNSAIYSVAWSPDAPLLAAGSGDGATRIWDADRGEVRRALNQQGAVRSIAWSPKRRNVIAAGSGNGAVKIWSAETGAMLDHVVDKRFGLKSISWSPDGRVLAFGGDDRVVRLWDGERKRLLPRAAKGDGGLAAISFSPGGGEFVAALDSDGVQVRHSETDAVIHDLLKYETAPPRKSESPSSAWVLANYWPSRPGRPPALEPKPDVIRSLCWSADGRLVALGGSDGVVKLCSASAGETLSQLSVSGSPVTKLALAADGLTLAAVAGSAVYVVNTEAHDVKRVYTAWRSSEASDISLSPDGEFLALNEEGLPLRMWSKQANAFIDLTGEKSQAFYVPHHSSSYVSSYVHDYFDVDVAPYLPSSLEPPSSSLYPYDFESPELSSVSEPRFKVPFETEIDLLKSISRDVPDMGLLIDEMRLSVPKLYEALTAQFESFKATQGRLSKQDKSGPWLKGKKDDSRHYVPPKETREVVLPPSSGRPLDPTHIYISDLWASALRGGRRYDAYSDYLIGRMLSERKRPRDRYLDHDLYPPLLRKSRYDYWSASALFIESRPEDHYSSLNKGPRIRPPVINVEEYYYKLKRRAGPKGKENGGRNTLRTLAWSPDGAALAVGTGAGIVDVWDIKAKRLSNKLEGHGGAVLDLIWSEDGRILASHSADGTIRVWRCDTWVHVKTIQAPDLNDVAFGISFHKTPTAPFTLAGGEAVVYNWALDLAALLSASRDAASVHYTSAKIVLVGESNVGKSCLALRLAEDRYFEQGTTHGMRMWPIPPEKLDPAYASSSDEKRDVILWDMGGQDEYRLVHQLFLHDTTVALILLDPTRGRTAFNEVEGWNVRLEKQVGERQATKLLVGTKLDTKSSVIDRAGLERLISACKFKGFYPTSAKADKGINKLRKAMAAAINWDALVRTSRPALFQLIRDEIDRRQKKGEVVLLYSDLEDRVRRLAPDQFDQKSINLVVEQLALQGMVAGTRLASGERVLVLQIGEIERYAGSIIIAARNNPRGVPALEEQLIASSKMTFPGIGEKERLHKFQERIVLECVVQLLLEHGICLKHEGLLIFPSLFEPTEREESIETHHSVSLYYDFSGAIDNIYSALIVRLAISEQFGRVRLWENRAEFDKAGEGVCGLRKVDHRSGLAHLDLFFSEHISGSIRDLFTVFVEEHLRREGVNITEVIEVTCDCGYRFQESSLRKRLAQGQGDIICPECEVRNRISEGAQHVRSTNTEVEEQLLALKTTILEKSREAIISSKVTFMESADNQPRTLPVTILHLSDLHVSADADPASLAQPLIRDLEDPKGGLGFEQLDYLVITGDLTDGAAPEEFEQAHRFISTLIDRFKLTAERCIIVPGNHDLSWEKSVYDWRQQRLLDLKGLKPGSYVQRGDIFLVRNEQRYPSRFENFAKFYHSLTQQEYPLRPEEQYIPFLFEDTMIQFLTMNSSWEIDEFFSERSGVSESALSRGLERADEQIRRARGEGRLAAAASPLRIAALHHPVLGSEQVSDDAFLERLRQEDFHLCLHGHVHEERVGIVGRPDPVRNIHVVGAGSVGAPTSARPESVPRLYNVIEVAPARDRVRVHTRSMSKRGGAWRGWAVWPADAPTERRTYYDIELHD